MRPDRIIVGECRGSETLDMLQAMNTGHPGSMTTVHANSPREVLARLETMVLMGGVELPAARHPGADRHGGRPYRPTAADR
jgi:pilus assembly protein CpaF